MCLIVHLLSARAGVLGRFGGYRRRRAVPKKYLKGGVVWSLAWTELERVQMTGPYG